MSQPEQPVEDPERYGVDIDDTLLEAWLSPEQLAALGFSGPLEAAYVESEHPRDHTGGPGAGEWVAKADTHEANHQTIAAAKEIAPSAALTRYVTDRGEQINDYLRTGSFDKASDRTDAERIQRDFRSGKDVHVTEHDLVLYRGMGLQGDLIGKEFTDRGLTSMSGDLSKSRIYADIAAQSGSRFVNGKVVPGPLSAAVLRMHVPAGTKVMHGNVLDEELILAPGSAYTIVAEHSPGVYDAIVRPK